uniref:Uncharacterized protein n=1 Tax=Oryza rufipogon TaxID=4529 RepID=A0A0E0QKT9_ORYRU
MPWFSRAVDGNAFGVTSSLEESFENLFPNNASSRQIVILWQRPSYLKLVTLEGLVRESGSILLSCLLCPKCKGVDGISVLEGAWMVEAVGNDLDKMTREGGKRNPPKGIVVESLSFSMFGMLQVKTMPWFSRAVDGNAFGVTSSLEESFENLFPNNASSRQIVILWQCPSYLKLVTLEGLVRESGSILLSCLLCPKCKGVDGISVLEGYAPVC